MLYKVHLYEQYIIICKGLTMLKRMFKIKNNNVFKKRPVIILQELFIVIDQ